MCGYTHTLTFFQAIECCRKPSPLCRGKVFCARVFRYGELVKGFGELFFTEKTPQISEKLLTLLPEPGLNERKPEGFGEIGEKIPGNRLNGENRRVYLGRRRESPRRHRFYVHRGPITFKRKGEDAFFGVSRGALGDFPLEQKHDALRQRGGGKKMTQYFAVMPIPFFNFI